MMLYQHFDMIQMAQSFFSVGQRFTGVPDERHPLAERVRVPCSDVHIRIRNVPVGGPPLPEISRHPYSRAEIPGVGKGTLGVNQGVRIADGQIWGCAERIGMW